MKTKIFARDFTDEHKDAILRRMQAGETRQEIAFIVGCSPCLIGNVMRNYPPYQSWIKTTTNRRPDVDHRAKILQAIRREQGTSTKELAERYNMTEAVVNSHLRREVAPL